MSYHVLIVEDDSALRQLYCLYLERGQYKYTAVASTQEVLDALSILAIDVLIADVNLGEEINGLELINIIRGNAAYDHIKIVTLTSFPERYDMNDTLRINLSLNKPVDYKKLLDALHNLLNDPA